VNSVYPLGALWFNLMSLTFLGRIKKIQDFLCVSICVIRGKNGEKDHALPNWSRPRGRRTFCFCVVRDIWRILRTLVEARGVDPRAVCAVGNPD
jgi:hypothetical protein